MRIIPFWSVPIVLGAIASPVDHGKLEYAKVVPADLAPGDRFGSAVALSGTRAIVGAPTQDFVEAGAAYLYRLDGELISKLSASDGAAGDFFGFAVAISGNLAIVGAPGDDDDGNDSGSAYVFNGSGAQIRKFTAADGSAGDFFGQAVAIRGSTALVGAPGDGDGTVTGSAYLFDITTGLQIAKLAATDASSFDAFGWSVAIDGNVAVVGAPFDDIGADVDSGSAYIYDATTGLELAKLADPVGGPPVFLGVSVGISGNSVIVGASGRYPAIFDASSGALIRNLSPSGTPSGLGPVAISSTTAAMGAFTSRRVYLFDLESGLETAILLASDGEPGEGFGGSVAISSRTAIVGASFDNDAGTDSGSAYLFDLQDSFEHPRGSPWWTLLLPQAR